jgi:hypothetical protein
MPYHFQTLRAATNRRINAVLHRNLGRTISADDEALRHTGIWRIIRRCRHPV